MGLLKMTVYFRRLRLEAFIHMGLFVKSVTFFFTVNLQIFRTNFCNVTRILNQKHFFTF